MWARVWVHRQHAAQQGWAAEEVAEGEGWPHFFLSPLSSAQGNALYQLWLCVSASVCPPPGNGRLWLVPALMATVATWPLPDSFFARNFSCPCFTTPGALGLGLAWRRRAHPHSPSRGDLPGGTGPSVPTTTGMLQCPTKAMSLCCCRWRGLSVGELCPKKCPNRQRRGALLYGISVKPPCNKCHWKELCVVLCRGNPSAHGITDQEGNPWSIMERKSNPRSITCESIPCIMDGESTPSPVEGWGTSASPPGCREILTPGLCRNGSPRTAVPKGRGRAPTCLNNRNRGKKKKTPNL